MERKHVKTFKLPILTALAVLCATYVDAQQTNLVQTLNVQLFGYSQGGGGSFGGATVTNVNLVQISTRQIIQALGTATMNTFSPTSRLVVVTPLGGGGPGIQVRDGNNAPVNVTDFLNLQPISGSVQSSLFNTRNGHGVVISYNITQLVLQDADGETLNMHFNVNGFTTSNSSTPAASPFSNTTDANVSGSGDRNGNLLILQGSVDISGDTLEVVSGGGDT